jgi:hypothetical protein
MGNFQKIASISLGLDLEVIARDPRFFKILTNRWPGRVCLVIYHDDKEGVAHSLDEKGIRFDYILPVHSHEELLKVIDENGIAYYYQCDDTIIELPQSLKVFRIHTAWEDVRDAQAAFQEHLDNPS